MATRPRQRDSGNTLLDLLPDDEYGRLRPLLAPTAVGLRHILHEFARGVEDVYFPTTGLISLLSVLEEDDPIEVATVGRDGMVGLSAALGVRDSPHRALCQMGGEFLRIPAESLRRVMASSPGLTALVYRYGVFMLHHISQSSACNVRHAAESRAARWLLMVSDQSGSDEFALTQEFLAMMLGVRRQTVTVIVGVLARAGLIEHGRGSVKVLDREGLEAASCECYATSREYFAGVVG